MTITLVLPAQCASSLGVVFVVVQSQQQLSQIRVYLMVPNARQNFEQEGWLASEALKFDRVGITKISLQFQTEEKKGVYSLPWLADRAERFPCRPVKPQSDWPESRSYGTARGSRWGSETPEGESRWAERPQVRRVKCSSWASFLFGVSYRLQEDEGLGQQVTEEMIVGQSDALEVSGGVDLLKQLRELRLQHIHLQFKWFKQHVILFSLNYYSYDGF